MAAKKEVNPLLKRLGQAPKGVSNGRLPTRPPALNPKKENPLLAALNRAASRNKTLNDRIMPINATQNNNNNNNNNKKGQPKTQPKAQSITGKSSSKTNNKVKKPVKQVKKTLTITQNKLPKGPEGFQQPSPANTRSPKQTVVLNIKKSAPQSFLRLKNLEIGTSTDDLRRVLAHLGKIKDVRMQDLASGSATAEVVFGNDSLLKNALKSLQGAVADGRVIHVEISTQHQIGTRL